MATNRKPPMSGLSVVTTVDPEDVAESSDDYALFVYCSTKPARKWLLAVAAYSDGGDDGADPAMLLLAAHPDFVQLQLGRALIEELPCRIIGAVDDDEEEDESLAPRMRCAMVELPTQSAVLWRAEKWPLKGALTHFETWQSVLPATLVEQAMKPGAEGSQAMRLLGLQALQAMAAGASGGGGVNPPTDMDFGDLFSGGNGSDLVSGGVNVPNGRVTMERVLRAVKKDPDRWNLAFDAFLKRHMYADVTGGSYSLFDYLLKRVHFGQDQHDLEKFMHILAAIHALYQRGPEAHEHLGAAIIQAFKACDQYQRDRS
jgi:hypothetical protein